MKNKVLLAVNVVVIAAIFILNYFYQSNGFDWFIGLWNWTDHTCMGTYYPALCLLAFAMCLKNNIQFGKELSL